MKELIKQIRSLGEKYPIEKIVLFGSRARGDATAKSDVDLAIFAPDNGCRAAFTFDLEELDTLLKFDVVFVDRNTDAALLENIQRDGITIMDRYHTKLENFNNAVKRLAEALDDYRHNNNKTMRDGVIQRFEFTIELAWKVLREYMVDQGYARVDSPKAVMKEAYSHNIINQDGIWISMLNDRNLTSHLYQDETAQEIFERIQSEYVAELKALSDFLSGN